MITALDNIPNHCPNSGHYVNSIGKQISLNIEEDMSKIALMK